jgi:hypothetical protein
VSKSIVAERDPHTGAFIEGTCRNTGGVAMYLTWENLQDILRQANLCRDGEYVSRVAADADGVQVYFEKFK